MLVSGTSFSSSPRNSPSVTARGLGYEVAPAPASAPAIDHSSNSRTATGSCYTAPGSTPTPTSTSSTSASPGHLPVTLNQIPEDRPSSHDSYSISTSPVRVASVQPHVRRAQPRPRPIIRTTSDSESLDIKHPTPDINPRAGSYVGNIQQLEATAERLSMTSSIDDAIRDLHGELKRSDSRRSSILAANIRANSADDYGSTSGSIAEHLKRNHSISSSIVSTNIAARHGGYSPGGYVMSPNHSLTGRLRSGSKNSSGRPDIDVESVLSRHGPGKASVRSVRSTKMSLAEISESEPISLTKDALDKADASSPIKSTGNDLTLPEELRDANMPSTDVFQNMMGHDDFLDRERTESPVHNASAALLANEEPRHSPRPGSSRSDTTFQQCQDAFGDFDGVHWHPEAETEHSDHHSPVEHGVPAPVSRQAPQQMARPQSYFDPDSGHQMLYYPARVPAMLNLPPKLSSKPKAVDRNQRRSQVLSMMMEGDRQSRAIDLDGNRQSQFLGSPPNKEIKRDSWLPDPLAGHRESFAALSSEELQNTPANMEIRSVHSSHGDSSNMQREGEIEPEPEQEPLRKPQRLTKMDPEKRKSRLSKLPPQLRASAYFDAPPTTGPEIEVKDGSAMATLDSILDASAVAPVSAFIDHDYAGKLGAEVYGREKKRASMAPSAILHSESGELQKKRSSFMWLGRHHGSDKDLRTSDSDGLGPVNCDTHAGEYDALAGHDLDGQSEHSDDEQREAKEEAEDLEEEDSYYGPPTTLLAELQLRKQQQKQRTQRQFPGGMHATLLEMDAVAETQRKQRKDKRVNLAWEDENAHLDEAGSDDEDVPLAIIAARNQGAQNVMDLNRPLGLMERRELEDNEPLSHRRARLHGQDPNALMAHRPSMINLQVNGSDIHVSQNSHSGQDLSTGEPGLDDEEDPGETLAQRKHRLAAKDDENSLPKARPVSSVFSAELLSQFGDLDDEKKMKKEEEKENKPPGEETLGERRRRLQAEREAREREMSLNQLSGPAPVEHESPVNIKLRKSMANVLGSHPLREPDIRAVEERQRMERANQVTRDRDARMAAYRSQMPTTLDGPNMQHSGGFRNGAFNDGTGGQGPQAAMSSPALHTQMYGNNNNVLQHRASAVFSSYGAPMQQMPQMQMQQPAYVPVNSGGSMNRIEQWRQSVLP
ncbi:hypothetical protein BGZ63DRAFT_364729 [Mariannaea sp. PMI_226]|nr:hypothetical protein BGZ63DRAFT_364729 [Mariannaea sp. PMI_226]